MAYIGNPPTVGQWRKLDDISGSFNGATTTFTTSVGGSNVTAGSANQLFVSLGGVIQQPNVDYSVTTNSIIFTTAPASGLDFFAVLAGDALNAGTPGDGTVTTAKLAGNLTVDLDSGSAAAPSLTFDSNTGLYSPGADQVGISTGGTSRITVDASGNVAFDTSTLYVDATNNRVGIGTTSPIRNLQIQNLTGSAIAGLVSTTSGNCYLFLGDTASDGVGRVGYLNAEDALTFWSNAAERARIDSSGRLLVSTSTSLHQDAQLQVAGTGYYGFNYFNFSNDQFAPTLSLKKSRGVTIGANTIVQSGDTVGTVSFFGANGTGYDVAAKIDAVIDGTPGASGDMPGRLVFSTTADGASSPTERVRITNYGGTFFNTTGTPTVNANFGVTIGQFNGSARAGTLLTSANFNGASFIAAFHGTVGYAQIMGDGDLENTNNRYTGLSDIKFKQNVEDASSQWNDLKAIRVRKYELIDNPDRKHIGCVAQELEQVCPGLVVEREGSNGDSYKSVAYSVLYMKAVKALQEAMERIETLEAEVAALKAS